MSYQVSPIVYKLHFNVTYMRKIWGIYLFVVYHAYFFKKFQCVQYIANLNFNKLAKSKQINTD